ncbi:MAG: DinB family protein [Salinisphaera sp.]|nr:DinB family protein [Salinisphaera sp.]
MPVQQARDLAAYNQWMNQRLYAVCAELSDAQRRQDRGVFFKSIHGTLNHLLLADRIWLGRFAGQPFQVDSLDQQLHHDFAELARARAQTDDEILRWANELTDTVLAGALRYTSVVNPAPRSYEMWLAVTHFFNHQTHHRGQLTAMLSQCGKDYGVTDIIWLPGVRGR